MLSHAGHLHADVGHGARGRVIVVANGLIDDDGDVDDPSVLFRVEDVSASWLGGRWRHDLIFSIVGLDLKELFPAKGAGVFGLGPLSNAAETEGMLTAIDLGLGKQGGTQAERSMQIEQLECSIWE